ncbi:MAG: hypothetical protein U1F06_02525 [Steroidobacteraceae bacterium]
MNTPAPPNPDAEKNLAMVIYALYAARSWSASRRWSRSSLTTSSATTSPARGGGHYRWQIRTFWFALLWGVIGLLLTAVVIGIPTSSPTASG